MRGRAIAQHHSGRTDPQPEQRDEAGRMKRLGSDRLSRGERHQSACEAQRHPSRQPVHRDARRQADADPGDEGERADSARRHLRTRDREQASPQLVQERSVLAVDVAVERAPRDELPD
jgi:hypothetical protein